MSVARKAVLFLLCAAALHAAIALLSGARTVAVSGVAIAVATTSTPAAWATLQANPGNTGDIWVGGPNVSAAGHLGVRLTPGSRYIFSPIEGTSGILLEYDLSKVFIDASSSGDGIAYNYANTH